MYQPYNIVKEKLKNGESIKTCYIKWIDQFVTEFGYLDELNYYDEAPEYSNCSDFDNVKSLVHDAVKTLKLFNKDEYVRKQKKLKIIVGKIVAFDIFAGRIDIRKSDMLWLINFIGWDCRYLFCYAEDWASCEEDAGYNTVTLELANEHGKKIKGYQNTSSIYGLLMATQHCMSELAEQFIINNHIKLTKDLIDSNEWDDMIYFFKEEKSYDLMKGEFFDSQDNS